LTKKLDGARGGLVVLFPGISFILGGLTMMKSSNAKLGSLWALVVVLLVSKLVEHWLAVAN